MEQQASKSTRDPACRDTNQNESDDATGSRRKAGSQGGQAESRQVSRESGTLGSITIKQ